MAIKISKNRMDMNDTDLKDSNASATIWDATNEQVGPVTIVVADHGTAATDQVINVSYGTSDTPPAANTTTEGSLYITYTA